ncbi:MAG: hypothetical protein AAF652_13900, partial [Cyanobacteria bacterium P01_C01_bin.72]
VNTPGEITFDFLYDGGWNKGELAIFSLQEMEDLEVGSLEFLGEASKRSLSNSRWGRLLNFPNDSRG